MGISVVRATAQYGEREGEQAQRYVNEKIYNGSTNLVEIDNWNSQHNINSSSRYQRLTDSLKYHIMIIAQQQKQ